MTSGMDDVFGARPERPVHPDFWRISEVVLSNDAPMEEANGNEEKNRAWMARTTDLVDVESVTYMAGQRAKMVADQAGAGLSARQRFSMITALATVWIDAFVAGAMFQRAGGHRDLADDTMGALGQVMEGAALLGAGSAPKEVVVLLRLLDSLRDSIEQEITTSVRGLDGRYVVDPHRVDRLVLRYTEVRAQADKLAGLRRKQ
jgi:hypothetical protein